MVDMKAVGFEVGKCVVTGGIGFGGGCLIGHFAKAPVLMTGGVWAISAVASYGLGLLVKSLAKKYDWNLSTVQFLNAASQVVVTAALCVTAVALGILGPVGAGVLGGMGLLGVGFSVGMGLYAKFGGNDPSYSNALQSEEPFHKVAVALQGEEPFHKVAVIYKPK